MIKRFKHIIIFEDIPSHQVSKLHKKLKEDAAVKLTNVHGVGYKLEV
tara:strand:- start:20175 stop:20315 length:141 start_codon:yes stop_codon:yes gene_type:complete